MRIGFTFAILFLANTAPAMEPCERITIKDPPFYLTGVPHSNHEDLLVRGQKMTVLGEPSEMSSETFLSETYKTLSLGRGSKVRVAEGTDLSGSRMVPVEVLQADPTYAKIHPGRPIKKGFKGFITSEALEPFSANRHVAVLNRDAEVLSFGDFSKQELPRGTALVPVMSGKDYQALRCGGKLLYVFKTVAGSSIAMDPTDPCKVPNVLDVKTFAQVESLRQHLVNLNGFVNPQPTLADFEVNDWGMVRLPGKRSMMEGQAVEVGYDGSYIHFYGGDVPGTDSWVNSDTACSFLSIMSAWKEVCKTEKETGCAPQLGDIAFITPAKRLGSDMDPLGHRFHSNGLCFDVRAFRKDGALKGVTPGDTQNYDAKTTRKFIEFLETTGASPIFFNDAKLIDDPQIGQGRKDECDVTSIVPNIGKKLQYCPGHGDHIHFCLVPGRVPGCQGLR